MANGVSNFFSKIILLSVFLLLGACGGGGGGNSESNCGVTITMSLNSSIDGTLEGADCRLVSLLDETGVPEIDQTLVDEFLFTVTATSNVSINLSSSEFDAYLFLIDSETSCKGVCNDFQIIDFNDDIGDFTTDALMVNNLAPGTYLILVNSFAIERGQYTLNITSTVI